VIQPAILPGAIAPDGREFANTIGMKFVRIEAGSFVMGQEQGGEWDEQPAHKVNITNSFYAAVTEVTNQQYELFDPWHRHFLGKRGLSLGDDEPVVYVNYHEAAAFCQWLSQKEGLAYRLATEAEWEYACRAGTTGQYSTGDTLPTSYHNAQKRNNNPEPVNTTVASTAPNPWGLYDMHGNVEEWCLDWYGPYEQKEQSDPVGRQGGDFRVSRGGSHNTEVRHLRSANRHGALPDDRHWLLGFRVVIGPMPGTEPLPVAADQHSWAKDVKQQRADWADRPDPAESYFRGPETYVDVPPGSNGPMYSKHNHDPGFTWCDNGDLFAIWYSGNGERGRELCILASRLRRGADKWDQVAPFWDAPDRNDHAPALLNDGQGRLYHFNGLSAAANYQKNLALIMRKSKNNGATWSKARLINPVRAISNQPIASAFITSQGDLVVPSDWPWHPDGRASALWISRDRGQTWLTPGGRIAGIHAGVTQLEDGRLFALGRGSNINGRMPKSISTDMGRTWRYEASELEPVGGGQRLVLIRLADGVLFIASFAKDMSIYYAGAGEQKVSGLFGALSYDQGQTWPIRKLITPGGPARKVDGGGNTKEFTLSATTAEPRGYMAGVQTPDGIIHLISSKQYYAFNLNWLKTPATAEEN
jgi:formylglycine-generating enzyme required for sulfatase activity